MLRNVILKNYIFDKINIMIKKSILVAFLSVFLIQCNKETGNKGIIPEGKEIEKSLTKEDFKKIAEETKKNLVGNLTKQISENGAENALAFCNVNAIPLTQKLEAEYGVTIKRVSDKNRNPDNAANAKELKIIEQFKAQLAKKEELKATTEEGVFYAPITTNAMCMQCHGSEKDIKSEVLAKIKSLYPEDKAIGYKENELRGLMVINEK